VGSQVVGSWFRRDREEGVALSSSDCNVAIRDSRSIIYSIILIKGRHKNRSRPGRERLAFFCSRMTLVHFFSSKVSYFFARLPSKLSSPIFNSVLSAAAVFGRPFADKYAMMDL